MDILPPKKPPVQLPPADNPEVQDQQAQSEKELLVVDNEASPLDPVLDQDSIDPGKKNREGLKSIMSTVAIIVLAPLIAFGLTTFIFQSYEVDGASMETTLQHADRLIVIKAPRTWAKITRGDYVPERGEVIIFNKVDSFETGITQKKQLVKRVIGLAGDRVVVKDGKLTVFNPQKPDGFNPDQTLGYGNDIKETPGNIDITVMADELFVMGDNRGNSLDSRSFGPINIDDVVGNLGARIFPFNKFQIY